MKYITKDLASYNLHLIKSDKFRTINVRIFFHSPIEKENITKRNILTDMLLQSSSKYSSRRDIVIQSEELYGVGLQCDNKRVGNYFLTSFGMDVLEDKYTEENNFEKSLEFLSELLFHPDVKGEKFKKDKLNIVKKDYKTYLQSIKENPSLYSSIRMGEAFSKTSPISYRIFGYTEDLDNISTSNLYDVYKKMIDNDYVDIFVIGNYDDKEMTSLIKKYFKFKYVKKRKESYFLDGIKPRKKILLANEKIQILQSKIVMALPIYKLTKYEKLYVMPILNFILGGGVDSLLFKNVREKNSLCYSIYSSYSILDSLMIIKAGIDRDNYDKTVELIKENINLMKHGKFMKKDMDVAIKFYKSYMKKLDNDKFGMIQEVANIEVFKVDDIKSRINTMSKVKKSDIVRVMKKINIDTIFYLEGVEDGKD